MHDDRADHRAPPVVADAALGMEHVALLGAERLRLAEQLSHWHDGSSARLLRAAGVFGKVQPEAADELAAAVVQLDRRGEPLAS